MPGPWEKFAQPAVVAQQSGPWSKYAPDSSAPAPAPEPTEPAGRTPTGEPTSGDTRNVLQRAMDNLTTRDPRKEEWQSPTRNAVDAFAQGTAEPILQTLAHPLQAVKGAVQTIGNVMASSNPTQALGETMVRPFVESAQQNGAAYSVPHAVGNVVGTLAGGEVGGAAIKPVMRGAANVVDAIPTRAKAGKLFESVMQDAGTQPVTLTRAMDPMERAQQLSSRGHGTVSAVDNLYKRINTANPLDYREARDWASSLSRLTGEDAMKSSPALRGQVKQLSHAFNEDVGDAAANAGRGADYTKAMRDYTNASRIRSGLINTGKWVVGPAVGAGIVGKIAKELIPSR